MPNAHDQILSRWRSPGEKGLQRIFANTQAQPLNLYGPTETTIDPRSVEMNPEHRKPAHIGQADCQYTGVRIGRNKGAGSCRSNGRAVYRRSGGSAWLSGMSGVDGGEVRLQDPLRMMRGRMYRTGDLGSGGRWQHGDSRAERLSGKDPRVPH